jgi:hypothetical protein
MAGLIASEVLDEAALWMNDSAKVTFTYAIMIPWMKAAINSLSEDSVKNSLKLTKKTNTLVTVAANAVSIPLPTDALIPVKLEERLSGSSFPYIDMHEYLELPAGITAKESLDEWAFQGTLANSVPIIDIIPATSDRQVRITYTRFIPYAGLASGTDLTADLPWNAKRVLSLLIAKFITMFVLKDDKRLKYLDSEYFKAVDAYIKLWVKEAQGTPVRKPKYRRF